MSDGRRRAGAIDTGASDVTFLNPEDRQSNFRDIPPMIFRYRRRIHRERIINVAKTAIYKRLIFFGKVDFFFLHELKKCRGGFIR